MNNFCKNSDFSEQFDIFVLRDVATVHNEDTHWYKVSTINKIPTHVSFSSISACQLNVGWSYVKLAKMILTITVPCQGWYIQFCLFCVFYHRQVFSYKFSMLCNFFVDLKIHPWSASFKKFNVSVLKRDVGSIGWCHHLFLQSFFAPRMSDRLLFHGSSSSSSLSVVFFPAIFIIFVIITFVLFHFSSALSPRSPN